MVGLSERTKLTAGATRQLAARLVRSGELTRVVPGLFRVKRVAHAPELIAHALRWVAQSSDHWLGYQTAMAAYGFGAPLPHPTLQVSATAQIRTRQIEGGPKLEFIVAPDGLPVHIENAHVPGLGTVPLPSPESVIIESLMRPWHAGGVKNIARFMASMRGKLDPDRIVADALELGAGAVIRRAGALLELAGASRKTVAPLRKELASNYALFDPSEPKQGLHLKYWMLRLNVDVDELQAILQPRAQAP